MREDYRSISFWHDSIADTVKVRPSLTSDIQSEVVIVGAGYTGMWTAYYLKQLKPDLDITILEAEIAGFGASGRNGGWCSSHVVGLDKWLADKETKAGALHLKKLMFDTVKQIGLVTEKEGIDCHYERSGALEVAVLPIQLKCLQQEWRHLTSLGFAGEHYSWLDKNEVSTLFKIDKVLAGIHLQHCAALHPARLARGLADCLERLGVKIYEHSPVEKVDGQLVTTAAGKVQAETVLITTEGYTANLPGHKHGRSLIPVHSMMVATQVLSQQQLDAIGFQKRCTFTNYDRVTTYGQITSDKRIAFGCRGSYGFGSSIRHNFDKKGSDFRLVEDTLLRFFPDLKGIEFTHAWGGAMGVPRALHPAIHFDTNSRFGWAGGFFGSGVAATHLAGQTLADLVCGEDSERLATPWINPTYINRNWEPEPLRWLGVYGSRRLMGVADYCDYHGAPFVGQLLDRVLPNL